MGKGRIKYVPPTVLDEIEKIKKQMKLSTGGAFQELTRRAQMGEELETKMKTKMFDLIQPKTEEEKRKRRDEFSTW